MIQPTTRFGQIRAQRTTYVDKTVLGDVGALTNAVNCKTSITPSCLRSLYKVPSQPVNGSGATGFMAFNNFLEQVPRFNDLESFEAEYAPYANGQSFTTASINGGSFDQSSQADSGEANLET
jgi:tripeptidyl-peptidase I